LFRILFDLRYAARKFVRTRWLTLALLLSIGLGIGGNVSVFGFARGLTRVDSRLTSIGRIVSIFGQGERGEAGPLAYGEYLSFKRSNRIFEWIGAARVRPATIGMADQSAVLSVAAVTSDLARALNLPLQQGVVISRRMWRNQFDEKDGIAGEHILINGVKTRVSGVAPEQLEELYRGRTIDIWASLQHKDLTEAERVSRNFWVLARLRPNYSIRQAQDFIRLSHRDSSPIVLRPYTGVAPEMEELMLRIATLFGFAAGAVFFVACANVAFFLLGRAFARSYETSLRVALGANRRQLASELFCDSFVISLAGGTVGLLLAFWISHIVPALLSDQDAEQLLFSSAFAKIAMASGACAAGMIVCGLIPLFVERHNRPAAVLNRESAGPSKASVRIRVCLVLLQAAVCSVLVISTAYLASCLHAALETGSARLGNPILSLSKRNPPLVSDTFNAFSKRCNRRPAFQKRRGPGRFRARNLHGGHSASSRAICRCAIFRWTPPRSPAIH
jgi:ABC-type antimicrobial peptide transport system permease subunit